MQSKDLPARQWRPNAVWLAVAAYFLFVALGTNLLELRYAYIDSAMAGSWGMTFSQNGAEAIVRSVEPGSGAANAGIAPGDRLRSVDGYGWRQIPLTGETLHVLRVSPGRTTALQFVAARANPPPMVVPNPSDRLFDDAVRLLLTLTGLFILWRGTARRSGFLLGLALMSPFPPVWLPLTSGAYYAWNVAFTSVVSSAYGLLFPLFAMSFVAESGIRIPAWARLLFWACVTAMIGRILFSAALPPGLFGGTPYEVQKAIQSPMAVADFALTLAILAYGWRRGTAESRHRYALLLMAIGLIFLCNVLFVVFLNTSASNPRVLTDSSTLLRITGSLLFAYAVLRHRVIDVGFTLNRTLVYGAVSAILLAAFGLAEWAADQVLALQGWESNALVSAGLAVTIFLAFHPVRHFVEHHVSTIFFRPWRDKEQALRKFVHEGGFFTDRARLAQAFAQALERFTGATCGVYRRAEDGSFTCAEFQTVDADDATPVALKARAETCEVGENSRVEGALAFPMIHCHDLEGFAVVGAKHEGERYRPDEIELIAWATRQIGQDLYRLDVVQLRREREKLDRDVAMLAARNADLQLALANRSSLKPRGVSSEAVSEP